MYLNQEECRPYETVQRIRAILKKNGIATRQVKWIKNGKRFFSVTIKHKNGSYFAHGKGTTKYSALASGYAEFMERLQNLHFSGKSTFFSFPDMRLMKIDKIVDDPDIVSKNNMDNSIMKFFSARTQRKYQCLPFYHYNSRRIKYLPTELIRLGYNTNGMCAGNSPEEALVRGVSEIFERHVLFQAFLRSDINFPVVPRNKLKKLPSYSLIQAIEKYGYKVLIKDCSLSGRFPVAGCLLLNKDLSRYYFQLGASPVFDTAVRRCITEICEGQHILTPQNKNNTLERLMFSESDIDDFSGPLLMKNFFKTFRIEGCGDFPSHIIHGYGRDYTEHIFLRKASSNKKLLQHLLKTVVDNKWDLFVRDVSYLGFPAFRTYIPGMEMTSSIEFYRQFIFFSNLPKAIKKVNNSNRQSLEKLVSDLAALILSDFPFLHGMKSRRNILLSLIYLGLRLKRYDVTWKYALQYKELMKNLSNDSERLHMSCLIVAAKLKSHGLNNKQISDSLKSIYGARLILRILRAFTMLEKRFPIDKINFESSSESVVKDEFTEFLQSMVQKQIRQSGLDKVFYV